MGMGRGVKSVNISKFLKIKIYSFILLHSNPISGDTCSHLVVHLNLNTLSDSDTYLFVCFVVGHQFRVDAIPFHSM